MTESSIEPAPASRVSAASIRDLYARLRAGMPAGLAEALWLFLFLRITFTGFGYAQSYLQQLPSPCFHHSVYQWEHKPEFISEGDGFRLLGIWQKWDVCEYQKIATYGYERGQLSTAFFPLLPALEHGLGIVLDKNYTLAGMIVAGVAYIAAMTGLYRLIAMDTAPDVARRTMLYISVFPVAFYFFAPFTESLFLALCVWAIYGARRREWALTMVMAFFAGLTRPQGALLALPIAWEVFQALRTKTVAQGRSGLMLWVDRLVVLLVPLCAIYGGLLYARYAVNVAGLSPFDAQTIGGSEWIAPWDVAHAAWLWMVDRGDAVEALNLLTLGLVSALTIVGLRFLPLSYFLFAAPQILLVASRINPTPLTSTARYMLVLFPAFVILAMAGRHRRFHEAWIVVNAMALALVLTRFLDNQFIA